MDTFLFGTYLLALVSLVFSIYAIIEIRELKSSLRRRQIEKRLEQVVQQTSKKSKGLWS